MEYKEICSQARPHPDKLPIHKKKMPKDFPKTKENLVNIGNKLMPMQL